MKRETKYYTNDTNKLFIRTIVDDKDWGWYYYYNGRFQPVARTDPKFFFIEMSLVEVSKDRFDELYFMEKL